MVSIEEIRDYINGLIISQEKQALCFIYESKIVLRLVGQYSDNELDHVKNNFDEITSYSVQNFHGYFEVYYTYVGV